MTWDLANLAMIGGFVICIVAALALTLHYAKKKPDA